MLAVPEQSAFHPETAGHALTMLGRYSVALADLHDQPQSSDRMGAYTHPEGVGQLIGDHPDAWGHFADVCLPQDGRNWFDGFVRLWREWYGGTVMELDILDEFEPPKGRQITAQFLSPRDLGGASLALQISVWLDDQTTSANAYGGLLQLGYVQYGTFTRGPFVGGIPRGMLNSAVEYGANGEPDLDDELDAMQSSQALAGLIMTMSNVVRAADREGVRYAKAINETINKR